MNATVPLEEVLPCSPHVPRKVLVCDSVENDGRFLLYTMAKQVLAYSSSQHHQKKGQVLWIVGNPVTERQVATALKKMGCEAAAIYLRDNNSSTIYNTNTNNNSNNNNLTIRSLVSEIATQVEEDDDKEDEWNEEVFLKKVYSDIKRWIQTQIDDNNNNNNDNDDDSSVPCWILLDDVSSLGTILGEKLVYKFVESTAAAVSSHKNNLSIGLMIRCSNTLDQELLNKTDDDFEKDKTGWIGAGGLAHRKAVRENQQKWIPWERSLEESVDGIVDVLPLTSGYSREAHGRVVFSEVPGGRGWGEQKSHQQQTLNTSTTTSSTSSSSASWNKLLFNYCIHDNGVRAIRLRV